jgi:hypothetical protein
VSYSISLGISQSEGPGVNQSTVTAILYLRGWNGGGNYAYWNYNTSYEIVIGGNGSGSIAGPRSINTNSSGGVNSTDSTIEVGRHSVTFNHDGNGYRGDVGAQGYFSGSGGYSPPYMETSTAIGAINYDRSANTPGQPSLSRSDGGTDIRMSVADPGAKRGNSVDYYHWYYSTDSVNFYHLVVDGIANRPNDWTWTSADPTQTYWFRVYAHAPDDNNSGWSGASAINGINGAPIKPSKPGVLYTNATTATITALGNNGNGLSIQYYQYRYSSDAGATWTEIPYTTTTLWNLAIPDTSKTYIYSTRAYNSSGWSAWSDAQYGVPGSPSSVTTNTPLGLKATVYSTAPVGTNIQEYYVSASKDGGTTWETEKPMGLDREYQYVGLSGGKNYLFRVRAINDIGYGQYTILSQPVFVPAGGKRWTGTQFIPTATVKRWTPTGWETVTIAKRWTGSSWEVLT